MSSLWAAAREIRKGHWVTESPIGLSWNSYLRLKIKRLKRSKVLFLKHKGIKSSYSAQLWEIENQARTEKSKKSMWSPTHVQVQGDSIWIFKSLFSRILKKINENLPFSFASEGTQAKGEKWWHFKNFKNDNCSVLKFLRHEWCICDDGSWEGEIPNNCGRAGFFWCGVAGAGWLVSVQHVDVNVADVWWCLTCCCWCCFSWC